MAEETSWAVLEIDLPFGCYCTYRTTRYSLSLYFLCVPMNVNYINVGTFVTETGNSASLMEPLQVIKYWNSEWLPIDVKPIIGSPKFFQSDYATEEINALQNVFPGMQVKLSITLYMQILYQHIKFTSDNWWKECV